MTRANGFLHWVLPAMIGLGALTVLLSGRDLSLMFSELEAGGTGIRHPIIVWGQRGVSLLLLAACAERVLSHITQRRHLPSPMLAWTFVTYWVFTVATPAIFGSHRQLSHEYLYTLVIGFAFVLATAQDRDKIIESARTALFLFMLAGVLLIPILPAMTMDANYKHGLLPGVPRLGGLATHPVALGMFTQTALLLLWAHPFKRRWLTRLAWLLGLSVLVLAQSKTAWMAFLICSVCMLAVRHGPNVWRRLGDPREGAFGVLVCLCVMVGALGLMAAVLLGNVEGQLIDFLDTQQGAQLMSLSGRDQIWAIAIEEWQANRLFGYGPGLWDDAFRASIGMPNAINAHNQFMDTLARSGSLGAAALVLYASVLLVLSIRHARATGGLSLALFLALALLSISEVPLMLFAYGTELFAHLMLLVVLASAGAVRPAGAAARTRPVYGAAS
jgi:O-antigen ligase